MAPPPAAYISELPGSAVQNGGADKEEKKGKMLYGFDASGDGELSVGEGRDVIQLEADGKLFLDNNTEMNANSHRWRWLDQSPRGV